MSMVKSKATSLKSQAHVVGDIQHRSLAIESGAYFDGRSVQVRGNGQTSERVEAKVKNQIANKRESRIERAESVEVN
jgi:cytoskeletal protein CcmA (bactofilin family)